MAKTYPVRNSLNAGEVSQLVSFREDISKYNSACLTMENCLPLVEGGAKKMPGTYFAGTTAFGGSMFTGSISIESIVGPPVEQTYTPTITTGSVTASSTLPPDTPDTEQLTFSGIPSCAVSNANIYVTVSGTINPNSVSGTAYCEVLYSIDGGTTWLLAQTFTGTFASTQLVIPVTGITNISSIQARILSYAYADAVGSTPLTATNNMLNWYVTSLTPGTPTNEGVLTVTSVNYGYIQTGQTLNGNGITSGTTITSALTGTGGVGTYILSNQLTVSSETMQTASSGKSRLVRFQFSIAQGAILEFSDGVVRIWEGATQGTWSLGLALQTPSAGLNYNPATSYAPGTVALVGPYVAALFYSSGTYLPNPSLGVLTIAAAYQQSLGNPIPITFTTNSTDSLSVTLTGSAPNQGINIALANLTGSKNSASAIQTAIRALGTINGSVYLGNWTVTPDPIYYLTPWITAPTIAPGFNLQVAGTQSTVVQCLTTNTASEFPYLYDGTINSSYWEVYDASTQPPIELTTPYAEADLFALDCSTQSADVLWVFHANYPPAVIERQGANSWTYSTSLPGQQTNEPPYRGTLDVVSTGYSALGQSITAITKANPCVVTVAATSTVFASGSRVYINLVAGMVELNQGEFLVGSTTINGNGTFSFSLIDPTTGNPVDSTGYITYVSGGFAVQVVSLFSATGDYPTCGTLYQQRLCVGGSDNNPTQMNGSVEDDYPDFISDPNEDDYAIQFTLVSNQVNQLLSMIGTPNALLIGTSGGVWVMAGSAGSSLSQTNVDASVQNTYGVSQLQPQLVNGSAIFVSRSARIVNFLVYNFTTNAWENNDLTRLNRNITLGTSEQTSGIAQTEFQMEPYPIYWAVRNDGQLIGLVFNTQDQVYGWFRVNMQTYGGSIESVAVISGQGQEDQIAIVVNRTINGVQTRFVEYFMPQEIFGQLSDAFFVHAGLQWNGGDSVEITGITNANPPVVTAANHGFSNGQTVQIVGVEGMTEINQSPSQAYTVTGVTTNTFELSGMDTTSFGTYTSGGKVAQVANQVTGMSYLMGNTVVAVGDGAQILEPTVVTSDVLTFPYYANLITIGIPYQMTIQPTNPVLSSQAATTRGMPQKLNRVSLSVYKAMGGQYGQNLSHMYELIYGTGTESKNPSLYTGLITADMDCDWSEESTFYVTQDVPFPFTLRGIVFRMSANQD